MPVINAGTRIQSPSQISVEPASGSYNQMQMQLSSDAHIPDGLIAAMTLLSEKPRQGVPSRNLAPNLGIDELNSTVAIGLRAGLALESVRSRYTGKERDGESGNDYFGARYYGSNMGRFMSADDGVDQDPTNPQSWNLYSYVRNNPLTNTDPDGHDCVTQTRTSATTETVAVSSGTCSGNVQDGQSQTYVAGTVTGYSVGADGHSLDIGYNSYDGNSSGVTNANGAPTPDRPNLDMNYTSNAGAGVFVPAYNLVNNATGAVEGAGAAAVAGAVGAPAAAAIARWGLQRLALAATSPALVNLIKRLYQAQDEISGGTAGAVRNEVMTGEFINGEHSIKASEMITALQNLIQSGTLSASDQMIAGHVISDLKNALGR